MFEDFDLNEIQDEKAREGMRRLLNLVEQLSAELREAQAEIQRLRDENNRLKGEQGKPKIKANVAPKVERDHSSEKERQKKAERRRQGSKKEKIKVDRESVLRVDRSELPEDAQFKGYEEVVVQDIAVKTDNVLFRKEKYYAPSTGKSYLAKMPKGYEGQFGPGIKAWAVVLYFGMGTSEPKVLEFFQNVGILISKGEVSNLLIKDQEEFHEEKTALYEAGLNAGRYQHTDDTPTRVNGQNQYCHVVCNPAYTIYATLPNKDRLTVLDVLRNGRARRFRLNDETLAYLENTQLSQSDRQTLLAWRSEEEMDEVTFLGWLDTHLPSLNEQKRKAVLGAAAVAAYRLEKDTPIIRVLVSDDAPQFNWLTEEQMLCWVHEGRAYKKLSPVVALHREALATFLKRFWEFYHHLLAYQQAPSPAESQRLEDEFDSLFATQTGYDHLDKRIALTRAKKDNLLLVLKYPELPLHNNPAELAARQRVRKRDVSFGPRTSEGVKAWDTFMSLAATTKKLGLSFYQYIHDRISGFHQIPPLADLVTQRSFELRLGWSFSSA